MVGPAPAAAQAALKAIRAEQHEAQRFADEEAAQTVAAVAAAVAAHRTEVAAGGGDAPGPQPAVAALQASATATAAGAGDESLPLPPVTASGAPLPAEWQGTSSAPLTLENVGKLERGGVDRMNGGFNHHRVGPRAASVQVNPPGAWLARVAIYEPSIISLMLNADPPPSPPPPVPARNEPRRVV